MDATCDAWHLSLLQNYTSCIASQHIAPLQSLRLRTTNAYWLFPQFRSGFHAAPLLLYCVPNYEQPLIPIYTLTVTEVSEANKGVRPSVGAELGKYDLG